MERDIGIGVIGFGWMGRVHTSSYRRVVEHFPALGVRPRLVIAADPSAQRRAQAERVGFSATTGTGARSSSTPRSRPSASRCPTRCTARWRSPRSTRASTCGSRSRSAAAPRTRPRWPRRPAAPASSPASASATGSPRPSSTHARSSAAARSATSRTTAASSSADYANRPDAAASWRFFREDAGSGALGDLMAHVVDMTHFLVGPIERVSGRTATMIAAPPAAAGRRGHALQPRGDGRPRRRRERGLGGRAVRVRRRHRRLARGQPGDRRPARADALRGPRHARRAVVGARADERARAPQLTEDGADEGYTTILAGPGHGDFAAFQPGAGVPMGYDDLRVIEADGLRGVDPRRRAARAGRRRDARHGPCPRGDRALVGQRRMGAGPMSGDRGWPTRR